MLEPDILPLKALQRTLYSLPATTLHENEACPFVMVELPVLYKVV